MNKKGLVLLSGGLDSTLAAKILLDQGLELEAINFVTCFCTCTRKGCKNEAKKVSGGLGIRLKMINVTQEYLEIVKNPKHGYGSNMNPCIDCRILMFKKAKGYMEKIKASFIVTGEVLGERPMSQRLDAMRVIEKEAGLKGLIVRPLSARLLEPSLPEKEGVVDRDRLLDIQGRSRKPQIDMANRLNIRDYPCPAGGCLLTDPNFAKRIKDLLAHNAFTLENIRLLKVGRHFRLNPKTKLVVGRNRDENQQLLNLAVAGDIFFNAKHIPGPTALLRGEDTAQDVLRLSSCIVSKYSDSNSRKTPVLYWEGSKSAMNEIVAAPIEEAALRGMRI